ncbi:MAG TPA: hypothetical protein VFT14_03075, partial [Solirubrobacterales bacterium]|nr:hypothetical protein [Solirubrobacterales bacterium]
MRLPGPVQSTIDRLRFDLPAKFDRRTLIGAGAVLGVALIAILLAIDPFGGDEEDATRVVTIATEDSQDAPVGTLGFPLVATRNTTRISGPDPTADAAAAALASHPPSPDAPPLEAAILVPEDGWQAGIAASVLAGPPFRAPILVSGGGEVPASTADALSQLNPRGGGSGDLALYTAGGAAAPSDLSTEEIGGDSPA